MNNTDGAWIGVIGTLAGGLLVGFITFMLKLLEDRFQREREDRKIKLEKLEELITRVAKFRRDLSVYIDELLGQAAGDASGKERFNQLTDAVPWLDTFISIYANDAVPIWIEAKNSMAVLESAAADHWSNRKSEVNLKRQFNIVDRKCLKLEHDLIGRVPSI